MSASVPSRLAIETGVISALWRRDMIRLFRERTRWLGVILQPMMFWVLLGVGMGDTFKLEGATDLNYLTFFFPGIIVMIVLFTTVFATMAVIEDRQQGFLQQLLVGPSSRSAMVAGKTAGVTTVALLQGLLCCQQGDCLRLCVLRLPGRRGLLLSGNTRNKNQETRSCGQGGQATAARKESS